MLITPEKIAVIDTETTGIADFDEVLQLAIIDGNFKKILNQYFKPQFHASWREAQNVNNISPFMVRNCPTIVDKANELQELLNSYEYIIGYNVNFDIKMLKELDFSQHNIIDVLKMARHYLKTADIPNKKLTTVAEYFGFDYSKMNAHNAYTDIIATMYVYNAIIYRFKPNDEELEKFITRPQTK